MRKTRDIVEEIEEELNSDYSSYLNIYEETKISDMGYIEE
jgi:hypothetical protein